MSLSNQNKLTEEEVIKNSRLNTLYSHEFERGRFFQVVHKDEDGFEIKLAARTMLKVVYHKDKDDIEGLQIIKLINGEETQAVRLSKFNFAQLQAFLEFINDIDLKEVSQKRLKLFDEQELDQATIRTLKTLLSKEGGDEIVETLIDEGIITKKDLVNTSFRKRGLQIFKNLINDGEYWKEYAEKNSIPKSKEEKVWQYFFEKNEWIFGYGLDYRFKTILQKEAYISNVELDGTNTVISDFLLGDKRFTTFVELKKPSTPLFKRSKNRSNSWKLSNDIIESVSQILEQKASGLIKLDKQQLDYDGNIIAQKAYDSKVVLIIGHWRELESSSNDLEHEIKKKTFELFRRDSRNIEIITFDELYDRAKFIIEGKEIDEKSDEYFVENCNDFSNVDDLPF